MKIDNSRIFTADIYEVRHSTVTEKQREVLNYVDDVFGSYSYDDRKTNKGVVVVYFPKQGYVPVWCLKNIIDYVSAKLGGVSAKFLREDPGFMPIDGTRFLKNIQPLFSFPGKTSLSELVEIQKTQSDNDDTCRGLEM